VPIFPVAFSSREMLVKRRAPLFADGLNYQKWRTVTRWLSPFYGGLRGRFHVSRRRASHSPQKSSNIRAIYQEASMRWIMFLRIYNYRRP